MCVFHFRKHFQDVFPLVTGMLALSTAKLSKFNVLAFFTSSSVKNQGLSKAKNQFQVLSTP